MTQAISPTPTRNALNRFEIPVNNLDRAQAFYETVLGASLRREAMGPGQTLAVLPYTEPGVGGALIAASGSRATLKCHHGSAWVSDSTSPLRAGA